MPESYGRNFSLRNVSAIIALMLVIAPWLRAQGKALPDAPRLAVQQGVQRFEAGVETADMGTGRRDQTLPSFGMGAEGAWNWKPYLAWEADYLLTPNSSRGANDFMGGHAVELLAGARAEIRTRHYGYFMTEEPGVFVWTRIIKGVVHKPGSFTFTYGHRRYFASDFGAGFEYSPSSRVHIRTQVTDLVIRHSSADWQNRLQSSAGVYYGFGKSLTWTPPVVRPDSRRTFFTKTNVALITVSTLASIADGVTTQRFRRRGYREGDPFARPLVKYGWSGQAAGIAIEMSGETLGMYGLHRIGHDWLTHTVPVAISAAHAVFTYRNTDLPARKRHP